MSCDSLVESVVERLNGFLDNQLNAVEMFRKSILAADHHRGHFEATKNNVENVISKNGSIGKNLLLC